MRVSSASSSPGPTAPARRPRRPPARAPRRRPPSRSAAPRAGHLIEHVVGVELARELAPGPGEALRERAGAALALEQLAPLERAARRGGDLAGELRAGRRRSRARPRRRRARARPRPRGCPSGTARSESRPPRPPRPRGPLPKRLVVARSRARRAPFPPRRPRDERARLVPRWAARAGRRARTSRPARARPPAVRSTAAESPPSASAAAWATASSVSWLGERLAQHGGDPVEAALDPRLAGALLVGLRVPERDRGEAGEGLDQPQVRLLEAAGSRDQTPSTPRDLAEGEDRRVHHLGELRVGAGGRRLLGLGEVAPQHGLAGRDRRRRPCRRPESCARSRSRAGPSTARQTSSEPPGRSVQQSAASALTSARSSSTRRSITASKRRSLVSASPALSSAFCSARRRSLSRSRPRRVERDRGLAGDRLGERDLRRVQYPAPGGGRRGRRAAGRREDRRRQHGARRASSAPGRRRAPASLSYGPRARRRSPRCARPRGEVGDGSLTASPSGATPSASTRRRPRSARPARRAGRST